MPTKTTQTQTTRQNTTKRHDRRKPPIGNYEETSGEAIIWENIHLLLARTQKKKGYYLNYTKPIKIIDLDKKKLRRNRMDKNSFVEKLSQIEKYDLVRGKNQRYYFIVEQIKYSKNKKGATPHNKEYFVLIEKTIITLTNQPEKLFNFIKQNFEQVPITFQYPFTIGKNIYRTNKKKRQSKHPNNKRYFKIEKENEKKKIIECFKNN